MIEKWKFYTMKIEYYNVDRYFDLKIETLYFYFKKRSV